MSRGLMAGVFASAAWCALLFGLLAGAALLAFSYYEPPLSWFSLIGVNVHILWIQPAFDLLLFAGVACGVAVVLRFAPWPSSDATAFSLFTFLGFLELALFSGRLHRLAALVLAAGLATTVYRAVSSRREEVMRFIWRTLPALAGAWVVLLAGCVFGEHWLARRAEAALPPAVGGPNVLLIVLDTLRADRMGLYGYARPTTPFLDRVAKESVIFTKAVATSSWTLPAHASLFTGLYPYEHAANGTALAERHITLAEVLRDRGYRTAAFVANTSLVHRHTGLAQGFLRYEDIFGSPMDMAKRTVFGRRILPRVARWLNHYDILGRKTAADVNRDLLAWLDAQQGGARRPLFVFLNYFDAHDPYMPPREFAERFSANAERLMRRDPVFMDAAAPVKASAEQKAMESDAYDAAVAYVDAQLEKLFRALEERKLLAETLVVITSDHGEALFEHGDFGHSSSLYREQIHIPLLFRLPGRVPAGLRDTRPADLTTVPATILALAGVGGTFPGRNLVPFGASEPLDHASQVAFSDLDRYLWVFTNKPSGDIWIRSLVTAKWHFLRNVDGSVELYEWKNDPAENRNLAATPEGQTVVQRFLNELSTHMTSKQVARRNNR